MQAFIGRTETGNDLVSAAMLGRMAATLGVDDPGDVVPPLWHWMLFQDWVPGDKTGPDGHPARGHFLPDVPELKRRMWAGSSVRILDVLRPGEAVSRVSTILSLTPRQGKSGALLFTSVQHDISGPRGPAIAEQQHIVFRTQAAAAPSPEFGVAPEGVRRLVRPDPVMLFRYSALTGNSHRIHYDAPYATGEEAYPGLVVHGPLVATLLMQLLTVNVRDVTIRAQRPVFCGAALSLAYQAQGEGTVLRAFDAQNQCCLTIEAV